MINQIQDDTGADITIEDDGTIYIGATDGPSAEAARATINAIANPTHARGRRALPRHGREDDHLRRVRLADARQGRPAAHLASCKGSPAASGSRTSRTSSTSATRSRSRSPRSTSAASSRLIPVVADGATPSGDGEDGAAVTDAGAGCRGCRRRVSMPGTDQVSTRTLLTQALTRAAVRRDTCCPAVCGSSPSRSRACAPSRSASGSASARATRPARAAGASHYLEHLLFKGTRARSALDISAALDAVGGEMNAFTSQGVHLLLRAGARRRPAAGRRRGLRHGHVVAASRRRTSRPSAA